MVDACVMAAAPWMRTGERGEAVARGECGEREPGGSVGLPLYAAVAATRCRAERGGPGRARACAHQVLDSGTGVSSAGVGDGASWAGHCGHLGPVAVGLFPFFFFFSVSLLFSLFSLFFSFQMSFAKYEN
jgi:hypothetical protein